MGHRQYLNVYLDSNNNEYCCRYITEEGKIVVEREPFYAEMYLASDNGKYKTISGVPLSPVVFSDGKTKDDYINTVKKYTKQGIDVYGSSNPLHSYMCRFFDYHAGSHDRWRYACFDIEVETDGSSFPDVDSVQFPINAISLLFDGVVYLLYWYDRKPDIESRILGEANGYGVKNIIHIRRSTEAEMLKAFCVLVSKLDPEAIGGWNTDKFDWPYIINRMKKLFGQKLAVKYLGLMSPFGKAKVIRMGKEDNRLILPGRSVIDYMKFYKKLVVSPRPNYSLDTIANEELGVGKLQAPEGLAGWELWQHEKHYDMFFEYCVIDTIRAYQVMEDAGLFDLINSVAFFAHCNIEDVEYTSRVWSSLLYSYLVNKGIVPHIGRNIFSDGDNNKIIGGFTSEPRQGLYDWVVSFDLTSLYPSIMMSLNVSSDTLMDDPSSSMGLFDKKKAKEKPGECVAGNGARFTKAYVGAFPLILRDLFEERKKAKQAMIEHKKKGEHHEAHIMKVRQSALKVLLNSAYGCIASKYFPHYSHTVAEAVTKTGRIIVQEMADAVDEACRKMGINNAVLYCDTDSSYFALGPVIKSKVGDVGINDKENLRRAVKLAERIASDIVSPVVHERFERVAVDRFNAYENMFSAKREVIAYKALFVAKKKYTILVLDDEGVSSIDNGGTLKITGLEAKKPTHARLAVKILKRVYRSILLGGEVDDIIRDGWKEWKSCKDPAEISVSVYVNDINSNGAISKASRVYNDLIDKGVIESFNRKIESGDKIHWCYCKKNKYGVDKIAWPVDSEFPLELSIIDYEKQFETLVVGPTDIVLSPLDKRVTHYNSENIEDELW